MCCLFTLFIWIWSPFSRNIVQDRVQIVLNTFLLCAEYYDKKKQAYYPH